MACFDKALAPEWHRVTKCIIDTAMKGMAILLPKQVQRLFIFFDVILSSAEAKIYPAHKC